MSSNERVAKLLLVFLAALVLLVGYSTSAAPVGQPAGGAWDGPTATAERNSEVGGASTTHSGPAVVLSSGGVRQVIIISIDGLRPDALLQADTPNLDLLWQNGAYTWRAQTVNPSITLPAHTSMISGLDVPRHRLSWNEYRPERGYIGVPTIFSMAKARGLRSALFVGKTRFRHFASPEVVDKFETSNGEPLELAERAAEYFVANRPAILFIHFLDPDSAGHLYGWMSPQQLATISEVDKAIGILMNALYANGSPHAGGLLRETTVMVSTDHGGHDREHGTSDPRDMTIPWIAYGAGIKRGHQVEQAVRVYDTAATALKALGLPVPTDWDGKPVEEAFIESPPEEIGLPALSGESYRQQ